MISAARRSAWRMSATISPIRPRSGGTVFRRISTVSALLRIAPERLVQLVRNGRRQHRCGRGTIEVNNLSSSISRLYFSQLTAAMFNQQPENESALQEQHGKGAAHLQTVLLPHARVAKKYRTPGRQPAFADVPAHQFAPIIFGGGRSHLGWRLDIAGRLTGEDAQRDAGRPFRRRLQLDEPAADKSLSEIDIGSTGNRCVGNRMKPQERLRLFGARCRRHRPTGS